ncbi:MAG TPA: cation:proton antiporter [Thermomicrobiales bacterium]|nr:cation:proton antiporter [Thermomicrobiales bacterium]
MEALPHETELIATVAVGLSAAFVGGLIAHRLRLPTLIGYLLAGVAVGPFTPGFVADTHLAPQLAEIGVILLMFGVGNHFSIGDLLAVRRIALPGAIGQVAVATVLGFGLTRIWGWDVGAGLVFGLALSVASTVVLLRALEARGQLIAEPGRVAVGWLVVEDLIMVLVLVLLPAIAPLIGGVDASTTVDSTSLGRTLLVTFIKVAIFVALMLVGGVRLIPWLLRRVEATGSRELFVLAVLAVALGIAYGAAELFGVSFALGAFIAGVVVNESELSHRAAEEAMPLREAFAVLFFVSVGMLIDPAFLAAELGRIAMVVAIIILGKALAALLLVRMLGGATETGLVVAAGLSQVGEFSFILAGMGMALGLLPVEGNNLILAGALVSITLNPLLFAAVEPMHARLTGRSRLAQQISNA